MRILTTLAVSGIAALLMLSPVTTVYAQDEDSFIRETVLSKRDALLMSAVYPGLGQMTSGHKVKGVALFLAETISLVYGINAHENYNTKEKVYATDLDAYSRLGLAGSGSYENALSSYNDLKRRSDELDDLNTVRSAAFICAGIVYAYNIFDALMYSPDTMTADNSNRVRVQSALIDRTPGILLSKSF